MRGVLFLALLCFAPLLQAQYVHTRGAELVGPDNQPLHLRGTNLGNWLNPEGYMWKFDGGPQSAGEIQAFTTEMIGPSRAARFWQRWREDYITREDIHWLRQQGFNSIRVPINWRLFQNGDEIGFRLLDQVVEWSAAEGIYVVIDMHAAPGGQTGANIDDSNGWPWLYDDEDAQTQLVELWKRIAGRYAGNPAVLGYDLLNEPLPHFPRMRQFDHRLEPLYRRIAQAIREVDKHHVLILEAAKWDTDFSVFGQPFDANVMYEFHVYDFANLAPVPKQSVIQAYLDFRDKWHVPLWLGESGENKDAWIAAMRGLMEQNDVGWCFWPYKKMDAASSPVTFAQPEHWDEVVAYAKGDRNLGSIEERLKHRPPQEDINRAFDSLLENITYAGETRNRGYIRALLPTAP